MQVIGKTQQTLCCVLRDAPSFVSSQYKSDGKSLPGWCKRKESPPGGCDGRDQGDQEKISQELLPGRV